MSFYLQVATETADLIERGDVQEGSATHHSDFERLLGLTEHKKKQKYLLEQKRNQALEELEEGRQKRAQLRAQMQHARNQQIIDEANQKKEEATKHRQEQTLRDRLNAALSKNAIDLHQQSTKEQALLMTDPFLRFRAEENRIKTDKERFDAMKRVHGNSGSDLLRRFIEGASAWSTRKDLDGDENIEDDDNNINRSSESPAATVTTLNSNSDTTGHTPSKRTPSKASTRSLLANASCAMSSTCTPNSSKQQHLEEDESQSRSASAVSIHVSAAGGEKNHVKIAGNKSPSANYNNNNSNAAMNNKSQIPLTASIRPELRVPTAANLVTNGYGKDKSKSVCTGVYKANSSIDAAFKNLDDQDKRDLDEWKHRRDFYYRERIGVLEQMKAEGFFRKQFTDDAAPKWKSGAILGHDPSADQPQREAHPIDELHEAVRDTVYDIHSASDSWKVVMANQLTTKELSGAERAQNMMMMSNNASASVSNNSSRPTTSSLFRIK